MSEKGLLPTKLLEILTWADVLPLPMSSLISHLASEVKRKRQQAFLDEVMRSGKLLTDEVISQDGFIHCFLITYDAALRTERTEKIRLLAHILINSIHKKDFVSDKPELYTQILLSLTYEDVKILQKIEERVREASMLNPMPEPREQINLQYSISESVIDDSVSLFGISREMLVARLVRLSNTGLYILGTSWGETGGQGHLSVLYYDFADWIVDTAKST